MSSIAKKIFPNGVTCLFLPTEHKTLNISGYFPGGRLFENERNSGITYLLLKMLLQGALEKSDSVDADMEVSVENHADFCGFSINVSADHFDQALRFLSSILKTELTQESLVTEKKKSSQEIAKAGVDPLRRPVELFYQSLFSGHPYAFSRYGTDSSVHSISFEQIQDWREELIQMEQMVISVVGDVDEAKVFNEVFEIFGTSTPKPKSKRAPVLPLFPSKKFTPRTEEADVDKTSIVLGQKGLDIRDHRYYDLEILRNWLAGARGQLHLSLREKLSLALTVNAYNVSLLRGGAFFLHAMAKTEHEEQLMEYMETFFSSLGKLVIPKESFESAKQQAISMFQHGLQKSDALSYHMSSRYMADKRTEFVDEYQNKVQNVSLPQLMSTISELFSTTQFASGILRGKDA